MVARFAKRTLYRLLAAVVACAGESRSHPGVAAEEAMFGKALARLYDEHAMVMHLLFSTSAR